MTDDAPFDPHRPPLSACWWFQRFAEHYVNEALLELQKLPPGADQRSQPYCIGLFIGAIAARLRLTDEQSDALLAVTSGREPAEWLRTIRGDQAFKPGDAVDVWQSELGSPARWVTGYTFAEHDDYNIRGTVLLRKPGALHELTRWQPANIRHTPRAR